MKESSCLQCPLRENGISFTDTNVCFMKHLHCDAAPLAHPHSLRRAAQGSCLSAAVVACVCRSAVCEYVMVVCPVCSTLLGCYGHGSCTTSAVVSGRLRVARSEAGPRIILTMSSSSEPEPEPELGLMRPRPRLTRPQEQRLRLRGSGLALNVLRQHQFICTL